MKDIKENHLCVLAYLGFFITGFILLVLEKDNKRVKFHAMQSFIYFAALAAVSFIAGFLPLIGVILKSLLSLITLASYVYLIYITYKGVDYKIPYIGDAVHDHVYNS